MRSSSRAGRMISTRLSTRCARNPPGPRASRSPPRRSPLTDTGRTRLPWKYEIRSPESREGPGRPEGDAVSVEPKIGELFAGYGGLGLATQAVYGGEVVW